MKRDHTSTQEQLLEYVALYIASSLKNLGKKADVQTLNFVCERIRFSFGFSSTRRAKLSAKPSRE